MKLSEKALRLIKAVFNSNISLPTSTARDVIEIMMWVEGELGEDKAAKK